MPELVDIHTGHRAGLGRQYRAATWYPQGRASAVLAVTGENDAPPWNLVVIDLATFNVQDVAVLPRRVDGIQVSRDGAIAARMRPEEGNGWLHELVVAADTGSSFEPVVTVRSASGWLRRLSRIRHRGDRLRAKRAATDVILAQLVALTSLPAQFDRSPAGRQARPMWPRPGATGGHLGKNCICFRDGPV